MANLRFIRDRRAQELDQRQHVDDDHTPGGRVGRSVSRSPPNR
jgi:hypothetical protein